VAAHDRAGRGSDPTEREDERTSQSSDNASIDPAIQYFHELTRDEQRAAIKSMAANAMSDYGIASATRLSVEFIRTVIAERDVTTTPEEE
jgi:hypothetical protein